MNPFSKQQLQTAPQWRRASALEDLVVADPRIATIAEKTTWNNADDQSRLDLCSTRIRKNLF